MKKGNLVKINGIGLGIIIDEPKRKNNFKSPLEREAAFTAKVYWLVKGPFAEDDNGEDELLYPSDVISSI